MDDRSTQSLCVSCGESTTLSTSFQSDEICYTCNICGTVVRRDKIKEMENG